MRGPVLSLSFLTLLSTAPLPAYAQAADPEAPPPVLTVFREEIKTGRLAAHEKLAPSWTAVWAKANPDINWIALTPLTGDPNVVLFLEGQASFAASEESRKKMDGALAQNVALKTEWDRLDAQTPDLVQSQRASMWVYRPNLSFRALKVSDVAKARFMTITTIRVKPGRVPDYIDYIKSLNAAREKANATWISNAYYQVASGAPWGTFLSFGAIRSMAEMDEGWAKGDERQKAIDAALGGDQVVTMRRNLIADILVEPPTTIVYAMSKAESRPGPQFVAANPDFWGPKPAATPAKAIATKKEETKPKP
jgi:hypothetical protein